MIQKFFSKYGLAVHLALLAAAPLALTPFCTAATICSAILWLSALAAVWLFLEPSLHPGEHLSLARTRVRAEIFRDPFLWMCLVAMIYAGVRAFNSGLELFFNAETGVWCVHEPKFSVLPASHGAAGWLPFCVLLATTLVAMGLRHGIGRNARTLFAVMGASFVGISGLVATTFAAMGKSPFASWISSGFDKSPFWPSLFGVWLVLGIVGCVQAEARGWGKSRVPYLVGIAGTSSVLVLFAPPLVAVCWLVFAILLFAFSLVQLSHAAGSGAVARAFVLTVFALGVPAFFMVFVPETERMFKLNSIDPTLALGKGFQSVSAALSHISRKMWMQHPWLGVGEDAFALNLNFLAEKADWALLPRQVSTALNGYWMLLAGRGIIGALFLLVGLGFLLVTWILRLIESWQYLRTKDDADLFVFAVQPVVWIAPVACVLLLVENLWSPVVMQSAFPLVTTAVFALSASDFPRSRRASTDEADGHHHSES